MSVIENLVKVINTMEINTLKETLAYLLKIYVIDRGLSYEGIQDIKSDTHKAGNTQPSFTEVIRDLKNRYSMKELHNFLIEGDHVFISLKGKKYRLTEEGPVENSPETKNADISRDKKSTDDRGSPCGRFEKLEME